MRIMSKDIFWDVSGAEEFRGLLDTYCQGMTQIWIVYDITDQKSFQDVRGCHDVLMKHNRTIRPNIYLMGNKCDLHNRRVVQTQHGHNLATELGMKTFYELSVKTNEGVQEAWGNFLGVVMPCEA
ncbi:GTP-binding protein [Tulasnella sp. JGI-2019a]|nr:GTP-binding protein [Tulasnella sp. JGI-2019a]